jgi:hypothetical protein
VRLRRFANPYANCVRPAAGTRCRRMFGNRIEFKFESVWARQISDPAHAVGAYVERWVPVAIYWMSRPAFFDEFERLCYAEMLRQVHKR